MNNQYKLSATILELGRSGLHGKQALRMIEDVFTELVDSFPCEYRNLLQYIVKFQNERCLG